MKLWIIEYDIGKSFQEVKYIKKSLYEKIIHEKIPEEAFYYLKGKIKSKGSQIDYGSQLIMQDYLKPNNVLTFREQIEIFSYRSEMNELIFNFKGLKDIELYVCTIQLQNPHIFQCRILNNFEGHELNYQDILNRILHQLNII